jgi:hypothetical protein
MFHSHPMIPGRAPVGSETTMITNLGWTSENWSGYLLLGGSGDYSAITGCWTVPQGNSSAGSPTFASAWVGIDGDGNVDLIQTGTVEDYVAGSFSYSAWWEVIEDQNPPPPATTIPLTISPGDSICAAVAEGSGGLWTISLADETTGDQFSTVQPYSGPQESAEWIVERPEIDCSPSGTGCILSNLLDYGETTFAPLSVNGTNPDLTADDGGTMWEGSSTNIVSEPSIPNSNSDGFSIAYAPSTQPPPPASPNPTLTSVTPAVGPDTGGESVALMGTGIAPGASVEFGSSPETSVTFTSSSQPVTITPPGIGRVGVTVTNPNGGSVTDASAFTYGLNVVAGVRGTTTGAFAIQGLDAASPVFWPPYSNQGGGLIEAPAVVSVPNPTGVGTPLYIVTGTDHDLWVSEQAGVWARLSPTWAAYCTDAPAATVVASTPGSTAAYTLVVACRGSDGALWWASGPVTAGTLPSNFTNWAFLGGGLASGISGGPAVAAVQSPGGTTISFSDELTFFVNGTNGHVYTTTAAAGGPGWTETTWECNGHLAAASVVVGGGLATAFACQGLGGIVYAATTNGTGWDTEPLGGIAIDGPGIALSSVSWTVVVEGTDHQMYQNTSTSTTGTFSFGGWSPLGGVLTNGAAAAALLTEANNP